MRVIKKVEPIEGQILSLILSPPCSLLGRCVQKIREEMARGIVLASLWQTQPWFPRLMENLVDTPVIIRKRRGLLLTLPNQQVEHPLAQKMKFMACQGMFQTTRVFGTIYQNIHVVLEARNKKSNITHSLPGGFFTVVKGKVLQFHQLWKKYNKGLDYESLNTA